MTGKRPNLGHFAHPRNPYKDGIGDLNSLAKSDPQFGNVAKRHGESGKVITDWNDREYTKHVVDAVLRRDFRLNLKSPPGSLAPALTNKLNYLLWIEDIIKLNNYPNESIIGIDIGTGPGLYFAAIAARHFKWKMLCTESNNNDIAMAKENLSINDLEDMIVLKETKKEKLFMIDDHTEYFFSLCNPPFYDTNENLREREEYSGIPSGRPHEIAVHGGEVEFVSQMIQESLDLQDKVKMFTSLIGHKKNVSILKTKVESYSEIKAVSVTELCQGRTMRWVLAWTFQDGFLLNVPSIRAAAKSQEKEKMPITFTFPNASGFDCLQISQSLKVWLASLSIEVSKEGPKNSENSCYLRLKTKCTDWRGQRSKRRKQDHEESMEESPRKKLKVEENQDDNELPFQLDCQLYLKRVPEGPVTFQFVFMNGLVGKSGMSELVQCVKRKLNIP